MELSAHTDIAPAWHEIRAELRRTLGESTYEIWLEPLEAEWLDNHLLLLKAPADTHSWVAKRFGRLLESTVRAVLGAEVRVAFADPHGTTLAGAGQPHATASPGATDADLVLGALNPRYSFDQFIIGDGNRLAHAAALAVAELPGQTYNPLFLHAPPGLGKTHLLHAIGNYVQAFAGGARVRYATAETFTNDFLSALGSRSLERFKRGYRTVDVLLIDDIQFLASKAKTEEEFFHTFNALHSADRQLVLTCDRLPRQMTGIEERLLERFEAGLVAELTPPDFPTRVAILRKRAALDRIHLTDHAVLELIAERVTDNVRTLEGALIRLVAYHSLSGRPIDLDLAETLLGPAPSSPPTGSDPTTGGQPHRGTSPRPGTGSPAASRSPSIADIQTAVATRFGLSVEELLSTSRAARVTWPRQLAIHLTRQLTHASLQDIGQAFGGRNHATVVHACRRVAERLDVDGEANIDVAELAGALAGRRADRSS